VGEVSKGKGDRGGVDVGIEVKGGKDVGVKAPNPLHPTPKSSPILLLL
jgi:hypothetical protein